MDTTTSNTIYAALGGLDYYDIPEVRMWRGVAEVVVSRPQHFIEVTTSIEAEGWVGAKVLDAQRLLFGMQYDTPTPLRVAITLQSVAAWTMRYSDGRTRAPVPMLRRAANGLTSPNTRSITDVMRHMLTVEETYVAERNAPA